ncbi:MULTISPECIES: hypothetical protein [Bacillaceae]|uniref:hypothetical protein n=1 Tax=Bacillaceae TaxID=186817 RepID=UPI001A908A83|nr:hypothetical protein [Bacillus sp. NTK034]MBN8202106.1 hypothetical protein [Bacillus sp. NTK034]
MLIFGIFEQSIELEQALAELEDTSILREHILVVFMDKSHRKQHYSPLRPHAFEVGISFATGAAAIGASMGFALTYGPIIWGLIGAVIGFAIGVGSYFLYKKLKNQPSQKRNNHEVTVVIQCQEEQTRLVSDLLWKYQALSVGYAKNPS